MLWIIAIVAGFAAIIAFFCIFISLFQTEWFAAFIALIVTCVAIAITVGCYHGLCGIYNMRYEESYQNGEWSLVALQDNRQLSGQAYGNMFYVRASIDTEEVYHFYYQLENGGYKQFKTDAEHTTIFEQTSGTPHVVQFTVNFKNKMPKWLHNILAFGFGNDRYHTYELYIPKGSLVQDFTLDLQ